VTANMASQKGRATVIMYLDLSKAYDTILHDFLASNWRDMDLTDGPLSG